MVLDQLESQFSNVSVALPLAAVVVRVVKYSHIPFSILANAALGAVMPASVLLSELVEESAALTAVAANRDEPACMKAG